MTVAIIISIIAILLSGIFSGSEIAFVQSSKVRMEIDGASGGLVNRVLRSFSRHEDMFISTLLVGNNVVLVIYGIMVSRLINPPLENLLHNEALVLICNTLASTAVILLTGEFFPKATFRINPHFMMKLLALPLYLVYILLYPISILVSWISKGLMKLFGIKEPQEDGEQITIDQLDDYLQNNLDNSSAREELENEVKIFRNAVDFKDTTMTECMRPRNEIVAVNIHDTTRSELLARFTQTGRSKILVYDEDIDDITGYIHVAEMFGMQGEWQEHIKPVIYVPETMLANKLMRRMLSEKRSLAVVVDEFGGTAGMATLEDIVEEIFGEIEDEHDAEEKFIRKTGENAWECSGRAEIEKVNEECDVDIRESDEYHTLGGFILDQLGELPKEGDSFMSGKLELTILRMSDTRIELVGLQKPE